MKQTLNVLKICCLLILLLNSCSDPVNLNDEKDIKAFLMRNTFKTDIEDKGIAYMKFTNDKAETIVYMDGMLLLDTYSPYSIGSMDAGRRKIFIEGRDGDWNIASTGFINLWHEGKLFVYMPVPGLEQKNSDAKPKDESTARQKEIEDSVAMVAMRTQQITNNGTMKVSYKIFSNIIDPESVLFNQGKSDEIYKIIETKNNREYTLSEPNELFVSVVSNKTGEEFRLRKATKIITGYTYYSSKSLPEIKSYFETNEQKLRNVGPDSWSVYIPKKNYGDNSCISVDVKKMKDNYQIAYGWECDSGGSEE